MIATNRSLLRLAPFFQEVETAVQEFLKARGGFANGYATWVDGTVQERVHRDLEWCSPTSDKLTGIEVKRLGGVLDATLREIMERYHVEKIILRKDHIEHGCYDTAFEIPIVVGTIRLPWR